MKIDKKTYEILTYKAIDLKEGVLALTRADLEGNRAKELRADLIKQLEELKVILQEI